MPLQSKECVWANISNKSNCCLRSWHLSKFPWHSLFFVFLVFFTGPPPPAQRYLDGGDESSSDVRTEAGRHGELGNVLLFLHCCGDALLTEELQACDAVLHSHHVESWATGQEQARVAMAPAQCSYGALQGDRKETFVTLKKKLFLLHLKYSCHAWRLNIYVSDHAGLQQRSQSTFKIMIYLNFLWRFDIS